MLPCALSFSARHHLRQDLLAPQLSGALAPQGIDDVGELSGSRHNTQDSSSSREHRGHGVLQALYHINQTIKWFRII